MANYTLAKDPMEVHAFVLEALCPSHYVDLCPPGNCCVAAPDPWAPFLERGPSRKCSSPNVHFMNEPIKTWAQDDDFIGGCHPGYLDRAALCSP